MNWNTRMIVMFAGYEAFECTYLVYGRNNSLSPMNQLLLTLRFYASSGHLIQTADFMNVDVSTASRVIAYVSRVIASLRPRIVNMPYPQQHLRKYLAQELLVQLKH
ncbi:hypothetical protein NQ315_010988 [Exocentrus adspersus]|uniref:Nuclease HARBI1 n=1 Tax=Exocentrus adspersus TaxID=1586481 RepID=A0AAV8V9K2_9CUCU|nr:hypothetical protein NQ315_010988 [Exocentrus adspersus]